ncbi:AMP-binding protein, partial [Klebsiella pneumoniae]|uniref:AMP-binding protein n=1 Tax=Klebsiella pneumoniae TaxID=573 RepID=UPI0030134FC6
ERRLIEGFNATTEDLGAPACVHQLVEAQAARSPRAVAVVLGTQSLRYDELDARANLLAGALRARGVGPDVPVALYVERSIDMVVG